MKTRFNKNIFIGYTKDGERLTLSAPSWDCGWYWGFGYIGNKDLHTHWNSNFGDKTNIFDGFIKEMDLKTVPFIRKEDIEISSYGIDKGQEKLGCFSSNLSNTKLWEISELMSRFYKLKDQAEFWKNGQSNYGNSKMNIESKPDLVKEINEAILPKLFDRLFEILK